MIIPGPLIALCTFPGVIMHEIAHRFMCDILNVPVYEVQYFAIGETRSGHVIHHKTDSIMQVLLIGLAPLFINSFFCILFTLSYSSTIIIAGEGIGNYINMFLWWIGFSMGANAFPSNQDVQNILCLADENKTNSPTVWIICLFIKFLNFLSIFWIDFVYAYGISLIVPHLIFG